MNEEPVTEDAAEDNATNGQVPTLTVDAQWMLLFIVSSIALIILGARFTRALQWFIDIPCDATYPQGNMEKIREAEERVYAQP